MNPIREFCRKRKVPRKIEEAFITYCKIVLADKFDLMVGDTASLLARKIKPKDILPIWNDFVNEMKDHLTK